MGNFLNINGWRVPVQKCELKPFEIGTRERAVDGSLVLQRRAVKRKWSVETAPIQWIDANALWQLVQGRGHQWSFDGSTNPQDTTLAKLASKGGLFPTNSPTFTLESTTAADGAVVKWSYSQSASQNPSAFGTDGLWVSPGTTNLFDGGIRKANDVAKFAPQNGAVLSIDSGNKWQSSGALKVACPGGGSPSKYVDTGIAVTTTNGTKYVISFYLKTDTTNTVVFYTHDGGTVFEASQYTPPAAGVWTRCFLPITGTSSANRYLRVLTSNSNAQNFWLDGLQFEALNSPAYIATPWVDGTRASGDGPSYPAAIFSQMNSFTMSVWVRGYASSSDLLIDANAGGTTLSAAVLYLSSGQPNIVLRDTTGATYAAAYTSALTPGASWHHIVSTYDAYAATVTIYVDGVLRQTTSVTTAPNFAEVTQFRIGSRSYSTSLQTYGGLDEVTLLPFAASSNLVTALYNGSAVPWPALPQLYVTGDAIDGIVKCIGNVSNGSYIRLARSGTYTSNNILLSFDLEEV